MDVLTTIFGWLIAGLSLLLSVVWWVVSYLLWGLVWLLLPLAILAFVAVRGAEKIFGPEVVRAWVKARTMKFGAGTWDRVRPLLFALGVAPFRVVAWFPVYAVWHALISLFWKPRWTPWQRAWAKRWKDRQPAPKRSPLKSATK